MNTSGYMQEVRETFSYEDSLNLGLLEFGSRPTYILLDRALRTAAKLVATRSTFSPSRSASNDSNMNALMHSYQTLTPPDVLLRALISSMVPNDCIKTQKMLCLDYC